MSFFPRPARFDAESRASWVQTDSGAKVKNEGCGDTPASLMTWNPVTGELRSAPLGVGANGINAQIATAAGIGFLPWCRESFQHVAVQVMAPFRRFIC